MKYVAAFDTKTNPGFEFAVCDHVLAGGTVGLTEHGFVCDECGRANGSIRLAASDVALEGMTFKPGLTWEEKQQVPS